MNIKVSVVGVPEISGRPSISRGDIIVASSGEILLADDEGGLVVLRGGNGRRCERGLRCDEKFLADFGYLINPVGLSITLSVEK